MTKLVIGGKLYYVVRGVHCTMWEEALAALGK